DPALDQVEAVDGHAQRLASGVFDGQDFDLFEAADLDPLEPLEAADPVVEVDHEVAGPELGQAFERDGAAEAPRTAQATGAVEDLVVGQDPERRLCALEDESALERTECE